MMPDYTQPDHSKDKQIRRRILVGTTGNVVAQILVFGVSFLLTPFILNQLGATIYGLWVLLGSVIAYTSILDFGIWGTVIKHVAEYQAQKNYTGARALLSTVLCLYLAIAAL